MNNFPKEFLLISIFSKIVYQRREGQNNDTTKFNEVLYNLRTQKRQNMGEVEILQKSIEENLDHPKALSFESRFEGGNLAMASLVNTSLKRKKANQYNSVRKMSII